MTINNIKLAIVFFAILLWLLVWAAVKAEPGCPLLTQKSAQWITSGTIERYGWDTVFQTNVIRVMLPSGCLCVLEVPGLRKAQLPQGIEIGFFGVRQMSQEHHVMRLIVKGISPLWPI